MLPEAVLPYGLPGVIRLNIQFRPKTAGADAAHYPGAPVLLFVPGYPVRITGKRVFHQYLILSVIVHDSAFR